MVFDFKIKRSVFYGKYKRTAVLGGAELPDFSVIPQKHWMHQISVNRFIYCAVLDQMCLEAGVGLRLHEMPAAVVKRDGGNYVALVGKAGVKWFKVSKLIDATGDANITGMMGYPLKKGEQLQPGTLIHDIDGYDLSKVSETELNRIHEEACRNGEVGRSRNSLYHDLKSGRIHMHVQGIDGSDSETKTLAEIKARQYLLETVTMLRRVPGCEKLNVRYFSNECGICETWRIGGEVEVDEASYVSGYVWPDAVCNSFYPIDLHHHSGFHVEQKMIAPGVVPTMPYRA